MSSPHEPNSDGRIGDADRELINTFNVRLREDVNVSSIPIVVREERPVPSAACPTDRELASAHREDGFFVTGVEDVSQELRQPTQCTDNPVEQDEGPVKYAGPVELLNQAIRLDGELTASSQATSYIGFIHDDYKVKLVISNDGYYDEDDQYELQELIGSGTFGIIRKCKDLRSGYIFARKKLKKKDFYWREVKALLRCLGYPGVVQIHGFLSGPEHVYIFTQYITGSNLDQYLEKHEQMEWTLVLSILHESIKVLQLLKKQRIVHNDVKAENIMLVTEEGERPIILTWLDLGRVKIDFPCLDKDCDADLVSCFCIAIAQLAGLDNPPQYNYIPDEVPSAVKNFLKDGSKDKLGLSDVLNREVFKLLDEEEPGLPTQFDVDNERVPPHQGLPGERQVAAPFSNDEAETSTGLD